MVLTDTVTSSVSFVQEPPIGVQESHVASSFIVQLSISEPVFLMFIFYGAGLLSLTNALKVKLEGVT